MKLKPVTVRKFIKVSAQNYFWENTKQKKSIHISEFLGEKADWESRSKKFLSCGKLRAVKHFLASSGSMGGIGKIPMQDKYENAFEGDNDLHKKSKH